MKNRTEAIGRSNSRQSFVVRSISWRSDLMEDLRGIAGEHERHTRRPFNLSAFVNEAVAEKLERERASQSPTAQSIILEKLACLLAQTPQQ